MKIPKQGMTLTGAIAAALLASACCLGPLVLAVLGLGGAAFAVALEPIRPYLLATTALLLGTAFYYAYRRPAVVCAPGEACELPRAKRAGRVVLWLATIVVILSATFPNYSVYLF